ncbi:hypothetical protein GGX14DRAFT_564436 [Mycena pura]|uniref:Uncharacterized protein n=1 Tax=Mycena pura TaxID=153505 RepID=A0AAD6YIM6_9AGAR|nr:hypothetical protein GGX14DRAFT_564436 [Mycena pura]
MFMAHASVKRRCKRRRKMGEFGGSSPTLCQRHGADAKHPSPLLPALALALPRPRAPPPLALPRPSRSPSSATPPTHLMCRRTPPRPRTYRPWSPTPETETPLDAPSHASPGPCARRMNLSKSASTAGPPSESCPIMSVHTRRPLPAARLAALPPPRPAANCLSPAARHSAVQPPRRPAACCTTACPAAHCPAHSPPLTHRLPLPAWHMCQCTVQPKITESWLTARGHLALWCVSPALPWAVTVHAPPRRRRLTLGAVDMLGLPNSVAAGSFVWDPDDLAMSSSLPASGRARRDCMPHGISVWVWRSSFNIL